MVISIVTSSCILSFGSLVAFPHFRNAFPQLFLTPAWHAEATVHVLAEENSPVSRPAKIVCRSGQKYNIAYYSLIRRLYEL